MASYSLLQAFSGFEYDMVEGMIGFKPVQPDVDKFRTLWSLDMGWGVYEQSETQTQLQLLGGKLVVKSIGLPEDRIETIKQIELGDASLVYIIVEDRIHFEPPIIIDAGNMLVIKHA